MAAPINVTQNVLRSLSEAEAPSSAKRNVSTDSTPFVEWRFWQNDDIENALQHRDFRSSLLVKYRNLCRFGMADSSNLFSSRELS